MKPAFDSRPVPFEETLRTARQKDRSLKGVLRTENARQVSVVGTYILHSCGLCTVVVYRRRWVWCCGLTLGYISAVVVVLCHRCGCGEASSL